MDWSETTQRRYEFDHLHEEFKETDEYFKAFEEWDIREHPEEYGND